MVVYAWNSFNSRKQILKNEYGDVIWGLCVNAPTHGQTENCLAIEQRWLHQCFKLLDNVRYAYENLDNKESIVYSDPMGMTIKELLKNLGFPDITPTELDEQVAAAEALLVLMYLSNLTLLIGQD